MIAVHGHEVMTYNLYESIGWNEVRNRGANMTRLIIDDSTSRTPIGELLQSGSNEVIELRSRSGELLGTLLIADRQSAQGTGELEQHLASHGDVIQERMRRPPAQGLTTAEFLDRLRQLDADT